ncbi:hypothetical protein M433DRAFT_134744 [Acidomyces richmondensis BFW]|nr:MAG: hypothetical protein FE78DRAFT_31887 [Acidomyces sp. 'richmondensis']KYG45384.1 hypothetical protein M433DRAFT_134744 [Acidomyces richmondensis BFW]
MVLTVHHLQVSQSERIVWLCEELGLHYDLKLYQRAPLLSPPKYLALHPLGAAPVIEDGGDVTLAESAACADYIIHIHGGGRLSVRPGDPGYVDYLYWFHFANGTLQPALGRLMMLRAAGVSEDNNIRYRTTNKLKQCLEYLDRRLGETAAWVAGQDFTASDIMLVFSLTTMRMFCPLDLGPYRNVLAYLRRVAGREGYRRAMGKGDPELKVDELISAHGPMLFPALVK